MDTVTAQKTTVDMPQERPIHQIPELQTLGMLQPIYTLPEYLRCDTRPDLEAIIDDLINGECVPKSYIGKDSNPNRAKMRIAIMNGRTLGYDALFSLQNQAVINGKPSWYGDVPLGRVYSSGLLEDFHEYLEGLDDLNEKGQPKNPKAVCWLRRRGIPKEYRYEFSWADAETAGLIEKEGPWQTYWKRLLQFRARTFNLRDAFADVLLGMRMAEEHMTSGQWAEMGRSAGQVIDAVVERTETAPPRPTRSARKETKAEPPPEPPKAADPVVISDLYPLYDEVGTEAATQFPSGDWLDKAADYVQHLMKRPGDAVKWFENNDAVMLELTEKLGFERTKALLEMKVAAEQALEAEAAKPPVAAPVAQVAPQPEPTNRAPPDGDVAPPGAAAPTPPPAAAPAPRPFFLLKNHKDEEIAQCQSASDYRKATDWLSRAADNLTPESRGKLYANNAAWLQEADRAGAVPVALKEKIFPPPPAPKQEAPAAPPISTTPPPPPPVPAPPPAVPPPPAAPAPPAATPAPEGDKKPAPRKKKDDTADTAAASAALDDKYGLKAIEWKPEMKGTSAYFVALQADVKRLQAHGAPPDAFARLHELNKASLELYKDGMKSWAEGLERSLLLNAAAKKP
jgi:hypothetical protein